MNQEQPPSDSQPESPNGDPNQTTSIVDQIRNVYGQYEILDKIARDGFNATTDIPPCLLYRKMLRRYPEARVVLTVRSSGAAWARSVLGTTGAASLISCRLSPSALWQLV